MGNEFPSGWKWENTGAVVSCSIRKMGLVTVIWETPYDRQYLVILAPLNDKI